MAGSLTKTETTVLAPAGFSAWTRIADYVALTKPRVSVLVLFTVAAGYLLGGVASFHWLGLVNTLLGTAFVAAGASALNQLIERRSDAQMRRTEDRPLPAGRVAPGEVLLFGLVLGIAGFVYLAVTMPQPLAAGAAGLTFICYVLIYTPLKRVTIWNTVVGAVPGALPPVIGWTAARGELGVEAFCLFFILFFWQVPHFLAIAWIYREDYSRAGLRMTPVVDPSGTATGRMMIVFCFALAACSAATFIVLGLGWIYAAGALIVGGMFLVSTLDFAREKSVASARWVLHTSLIYLPVLMTVLVLDRLVF